MKIVGLIVEYNPFHNGHLHHIEESLKKCHADKAIIVMSGNFVQRGAPAIMPKHIRTETALLSGVSLVIELPVRHSTGSAEFFAMGAIDILNSLGCVDSICFGSECGDIDSLSTIADILADEPDSYRFLLQEHLKMGKAFPLARECAMKDYLESSDYNVENLLSEPNNILGTEYLKALKRLNSKITPYTIQRISSHYHDENLQQNYSSASAIRNSINMNDDYDELRGQIPQSCYQLLSNCKGVRFPIVLNDFSLLLHYKLLNETQESLLDYLDMTEELANRIINNRNHFINFEQFISVVNSKNITHSRISRVLIHIVLNIQTPNVGTQTTDSNTWNHYIHILGFRKQDSEILTLIKQNSSLPIITKLTAIDTLTEEGQTLLTEDINAANLYESVVTNKFQTPYIHEYEQSIIIL